MWSGESEVKAVAGGESARLVVSLYAFARVGHG